MAVYRYQFYAQNERGDVIPGAVVTVRRESDSGVASIFSDSAGATPKSNPFMCDDNGYGFFYVAPGYYRIAVSSGIYSMEWRDVYIGTSAIDALSDVQITGRADNDVLRWSVSLNKWVVSKARVQATSNPVFYVRTDGNDSNAGTGDSAGGAFLTLQRAIDVVGTLDLAGFTATINVRAGTFAPVVLRRLLGGICNVIGDTTTPTNVVINSSGSSNIYGDDVSGWFFDGFYFTGNAYHVQLTNGASLDLGRVNFGATNTAFNTHKLMQNNSRLRHLNVYTISGSAYAHEQLDTGARLQNFGFVHSITGTPAWTLAFVFADTTATANYGGASWSGSVTGKRYDLNGNSVVKSFGVTLPGSVAGTTATGGQFI